MSNKTPTSMLVIYGASDDIITFAGSIYEEVSAYNADVLIRFDRVILRYYWHARKGWRADIVANPDNVAININASEDKDPADRVPLITVQQTVKAVEIVDHHDSNKPVYDYISDSVNEIDLSDSQREILQKLKTFRIQGDELEDLIDERRLISWVLFNIK